VTASDGPLTGFRVLDLGHVLAAPFAATLLADLGADVIKVEHPERGDTIRTLGPQYEHVSLWWKVAGRNKRSLTLDLRAPAARDILLRLVDRSDALVENFRPGTLERWQIGPDVLRARNPGLVVLRISGFGQAEHGRPGFGRVGEAMSGAVNLTGERRGRPLHVGFSLADATTGLMGAFAVASALLGRERTGRGDVIDLALFEPLFRMIEWQIPIAEKLGRVIRRQGNAFPIGYAVGGSYPAADGRWVTISAATEASIRNVLEIVGGETMRDDARFADFEARSEPGHMEEIDRRVAAWIAERDADEVVRALQQRDVAVGLVFDAGMMLDDAFFAERGAIVAVDDPDLGSLSMPGVVPKLAERPGQVRWAGPRLGEHDEEILCGLLGLSGEEVAELREQGIVREGEPQVSAGLAEEAV
jgi:crotonobetainyl-CoA:carnitine CoA-transferase CaiB-like acyl-CoA transferase